MSSKYLFLGITAGRTEVIVHQMAENVVPLHAQKADKRPVQESPDIQTPDLWKVITTI
jgi:hypothetical protein